MPIMLLRIGDKQLTATQLATIQAHVPPSMTFVQSTDEQTILSIAPEIEIIAGWFKSQWLLEMPNLRWAHQWGAGVNWLMRFPALREKPFILTNSSGVHAIQISEQIFAYLLAFGRQLRHAQNAQQAHVWANMYHPSEEYGGKPFAFSSGDVFELADKTMVVVGVGAIGERTAKLAQAFDMHVIGVRNNPTHGSPFVDQMVGPDQLPDVLPKADFLVLTVPLTHDTRHMIAEPQLALMKSTAYIVNIGRGELIDEPVLTRFLQEKRIAGTALDVFEQEPLPSDSALWDLDNVLITSHYAGGSPRYHERAAAILIDNLQRYQAGRPLRNVVDKMQGY